MTKGIKLNLVTYAVLLAIAAAGLAYGNAIQTAFPNLRVWNLNILLLLLLAVPFLFFQAKAGFPDFWESRISNKFRIFLPLAIGVVFGLLDVLVFKVSLNPTPSFLLFSSLFPIPSCCIFQGPWKWRFFTG
jgi:hypothetical protein